MKVNCTRQHVGYGFDLSASLAKTVTPSFQDSVLSRAHTGDGTVVYQFRIHVWTVGTAVSGAAVVTLIFMWDGMVHRNELPFFFQLVSFRLIEDI
jgi:hypothetical protein